ncbi:MAG: HAMP domain-containing histidine kinase [Lachnospiraceae bacterium]|nr:HAMP domain-containing histidine kinase [Lachnospiraceae bacterium]
MENKKSGFIRNGIFNIVCAVLCAASVTVFIYVMVMMLLARSGGFHGMTFDQTVEKAMDRISEHNMADLSDSLKFEVPHNEEKLEELLPEMKENWEETLNRYGDMKNVSFAVIVSRESNPDRLDLGDENTYLYKSPGYDRFDKCLTRRMFDSHYINYYMKYEVVMNDCAEYRYANEGSSDTPGYYIHVLYKRAAAIYPNEKEYYDNLYLDTDIREFLFRLNKMDTNGGIYGMLSALSAICFLILFAISAGYHRRSEGISLTLIDRMPLEIVYFLAVNAEIFLAYVLYSIIGQIPGIMDRLASFYELVLLSCSVMFIAVLLGMIFLGTNIVRIKAGTFWRNSLIYRIKDVVFKLVSKACMWIAKHVPLGILLMIAIPVYGVISIVEAALIQDGSNFLAFLFVLGRLAEAALILYLIWGYSRLRDGAKRIAAGNLSEPVDEKYLFAGYRLFAQDLNGVSESIQLAVEERMKSERMKTQLITNVSHDIKTPLTSIINYIDLLKKDDATDSDKEEYLEILSKQSERLKKLIQDLIEASKASSGAVDVNLTELDLCTLAGQVMGEYQDKLEQAGLTLVSRIPEESVTVKADSNLLWRVMDNLYGNVLKYAMPGTRVYTELSADEGAAVLSISNISKEELGISGDELMDRFVRGDRSRNTEGSGLGLSIAGSLMELMGGELKITVDGDMFKAVISIPR